jgi:hypothetical protein
MVQQKIDNLDLQIRELMTQRQAISQRLDPSNAFFLSLLQQIPIKPATKETTSKAQSRYHNDETN